jgi:hypothetical protein
VIARNWVKDCRVGSRAAKGVLMVLADAAKEKVIDGGTGTAHQCFMEQATVAERAEYSVPSVQRALDLLSDKGLVLRKFRHDKRTGYRISSEFFLNTNNEPIHAFAARCCVEWKPSPAKTPKHHFDGKASRGLNIIREAPTPQNDVASTSNRDSNRESARAKRSSRTTELAPGLTLPDEWRQMARTEFDATDEQIERLWKRFHNHYRHIAKPKARRCRNWLAKFRDWCLEDLPNKKGGGQACPSNGLSDDAWSAQVKFWVETRFWNPAIGAAPNEAGCRVPRPVLEKFGLAAKQQAA